MVNPADPINYNVLQRQANLIIDMNHDRNELVHSRIHAWKEHCMRNSIDGNSGMYTQGKEYDDLLELGRSIIAHLMLAYSETSTGFWYELLHEIVHGVGKKTGFQRILFLQLYAEWNEWFQKMNHSQAPHYVNGERVLSSSGTREPTI